MVNFILSLGISGCFTLPTKILKGSLVDSVSDVQLQIYTDKQKSGEMCEESGLFFFFFFVFFANIAS